MMAAVRAYASWEYFDYRLAGDRFDDGYQSVPVNWTISSQRKREFFELLATVTGVGVSDAQRFSRDGADAASHALIRRAADPFGC